MLNGQCLLARRAALAGAGGFAPVRGHLTDDIALGRALARRGWRIGFLDGRELLEVDMHASAAEVWREWGRSLPMADVTSPGWQAADLAVLGLTTALPLARLLGRRATALDLGLLALRGALLGPLRASYAQPGPGLYCSPLADILAFTRMTGATLRPVRSWRGRSYPPAGTASPVPGRARAVPGRARAVAGRGRLGRRLRRGRPAQPGLAPLAGQRGHPEPQPDERHERTGRGYLQRGGEQQLQ